VTSIPFAGAGLRGEAAESLAGKDLPALAARLLDPGIATATLHWGRNYIYRATLTAAAESPAVAVKQFHDPRGVGTRGRSRRSAGAKAEKSFRRATEFAAAGIATPRPLLWAENATRSTAVFVTPALEGFTELRYLLRARNAGTDRESYPDLDVAEVLVLVARLARRMHDAGFWHRDFSIGNLLLRPSASAGEPAEVVLVDLNRSRRLASVPTGARMRDLCRLPLDRSDDRERLLAAYFGGAVPGAGGAIPKLARLRYEAARRAFLHKNRLKGGLRAVLAEVRSWVVPRGTHAHIPPAPEGAVARDKIVWDALSDQPHSHASRLERAKIRVADFGSHARSVAALVGAAPRIRRRYRELARSAVAPFPWLEPGIAIRPWPENPEALLAAFDELGARRALVRLHPWASDHDAEEALARELASRGVELAFTLPQDRELVKDRARWRGAIEELAERFTRYGTRFQIGQAVNRSKWGIWSHDEYLELAADAAEILRRPRPGSDRRGPVELFGPAVIDFEAHVTAGIVNRRHPTLSFDGLASLLYVDRRGAPENEQLGFDTEGKVRLLAAVAGTGRLVDSGRQWISEVNWPLREGPHSPAGKAVSVSEQEQADYLARFFLLAAGTGLVERIDWWQLVAKGYGLVDPQADGTLRRRPAFRAFATLRRELAGAVCHGSATMPDGARGIRFERDGRTIVAAWAPAGRVDWRPEAAVSRVVARDGEDEAVTGASVGLSGGVRYLTLA
jgi:hypothetical protein